MYLFLFVFNTKKIKLYSAAQKRYPPIQGFNKFYSTLSDTMVLAL